MWFLDMDFLKPSIMTYMGTPRNMCLLLLFSVHMSVYSPTFMEDNVYPVLIVWWLQTSEWNCSGNECIGTVVTLKEKAVSRLCTDI